MADPTAGLGPRRHGAAPQMSYGPAAGEDKSGVEDAAVPIRLLVSAGVLAGGDRHEPTSSPASRPGHGPKALTRQVPREERPYEVAGVGGIWSCCDAVGSPASPSAHLNTSRSASDAVYATSSTGSSPMDGCLTGAGPTINLWPTGERHHEFDLSNQRGPPPRTMPGQRRQGRESLPQRTRPGPRRRPHGRSHEPAAQAMTRTARYRPQLEFCRDPGR